MNLLVVSFRRPQNLSFKKPSDMTTTACTDINSRPRTPEEFLQGLRIKAAAYILTLQR